MKNSEHYSKIGYEEIGGKASGLIQLMKLIDYERLNDYLPEINVSVPRFTVVASEFFDKFIKKNKLLEIDFESSSDSQIALHFLQAELPTELVGRLWELIRKVKYPLAIRSSSLLEDAVYEPFAGVYATKMIPNNQFRTEERFRKLVDAIKLVYASTYFEAARTYMQATKHNINDEKMCVIIQDVVGKRYGDRYYPHISGVTRSYNYFPTGHAQPSDGLVNLALGLGKTIVDDGISWSYSPSYPRANPPYNSLEDLLRISQNYFWAVNMGETGYFDPTKETEYLIRLSYTEAEKDGTLKFLVSTYDPVDQRVYPGPSAKGIKFINFAPILIFEQVPLNSLLIKVMEVVKNYLGQPVETEFAVTLDDQKGVPANFCLLQMRPMAFNSQDVEVDRSVLNDSDIILYAEIAMGNGIIENIWDVVYVKPEVFEVKNSLKIASEIKQINNKFNKSGRRYLLIGFGRWGTSDPWLGIPVNWVDIHNALTIVETKSKEINFDFSQGAHFFHNLTSFQIPYLACNSVDWQWLNKQEVVEETENVRHVKLKKPIIVKVDGKRNVGVVLK